MPRLIHTRTGSIVNVPGSLVADLGGEWRLPDAPDPTPGPEPEAEAEQAAGPEPEAEAEQAAGPEPGPAPKKPARAKK